MRWERLIRSTSPNGRESTLDRRDEEFVVDWVLGFSDSEIRIKYGIHMSTYKRRKALIASMVDPTIDVTAGRMKAVSRAVRGDLVELDAIRQPVFPADLTETDKELLVTMVECRDPVEVADELGLENRRVVLGRWRDLSIRIGANGDNSTLQAVAMLTKFAMERPQKR